MSDIYNKFQNDRPVFVRRICKLGNIFTNMVIGIILIILLGIVFINSYSKFNSWTRQNEHLLQSFNSQMFFDPTDFEGRYHRAVCLMNLQNYPAAVNEFDELIKDSAYLLADHHPLVVRTRVNIEFCLKPLPWSSKPENKTGDFIHYFWLVRFGKKRYSS